MLQFTNLSVSKNQRFIYNVNGAVAVLSRKCDLRDQDWAGYCEVLPYRYGSALANILKPEVNPSLSNKNIYRRLVTSLGSPFWGEN